MGPKARFITLCAIIGILLLADFVAANESRDMNITHGHSDEYFEEKKLQAKQGKASGKDKTVVHIIPHSHDDVGWLKTLDQYFWGLREDIQRANVYLIIDSAITELTLNPERRYTEVEMAFFMRWWEQQDDAKKETVRNLVNEGRLEIVNAGWSMNDEACPYYTQIIDNMMIGHRFLKEELGVATNVGWHLDPFGHSSANAALFEDMGFDAFFYSRLDYQDKAKRLEEKSMEYIWRPFDKDSSAEIFTHAMFDHYYPPPGFCWATSSCHYYDDPIVNNEKLKTHNYKERIAEMYEWLAHMRDHYRTGNLLIPMGTDFSYKNAHKIYINTDRLIKYFNEEYDDFELVYSTPSQYVKAVHDSGVAIPLKYGDQFPYAEREFSYWTGYFTSRAVSKGNIRQLERHSSNFNKHWTQAILNEKVSKDQKIKLLGLSQEALRVLGVMQHHDAVTGTEKQHVADDYQKQIDKIEDSTKKANTETLKAVFEAKFSEGIFKDIIHCNREVDQYLTCPEHTFDIEEDPILIVEKNDLESILRVTLPHANMKLIDPKSFMDIQGQSIHCPEDRNGCILHVRDKRVGTLVYKFVKDEHASHQLKSQSCDRIWNQYQSIMNTHMTPTEATVWVVSCDTPKDDPFFADRSDCADRNITFGLRAYDGYDGHGQSSGAYIFRPANGTTDSSPYWEINQLNCYKKDDNTYGALEYKSDQGTVTLSLMDNDPIGIQVFTEFNGIHETKIGKEVTMNVEVLNFKNEEIFYTDSNGLQMQKRVLNQRPDFDLQIQGTEEITANYYPINSAISVVDTLSGHGFTVLNDRSQGGSVLREGRIELMIDRRLFADDDKGVEEALNETDANGKPLPVHIHNIWLLEKDHQNFSEENGYSKIKMAQRRLSSNSDMTIARKNAMANFDESQIESLSASNGNLYTQVYPVALDEIIIRVENPEDWYTAPSMQYICFNITEIADDLYAQANNYNHPSSISIQEVTLTASETVEEREAHRITWNIEGEEFPTKIEKKENALYRQEMRTFRVKYGSRMNGSQIVKE
ncbi:unnamed protein product [Moneuplotes crassus]|uniref:Glycoside hydrolase family 38 central domain-containing protein n=2 Tax=Euplotes crassus TaxID=5936 RepID=A0AAD1XUM4_EUPCR|nr:unnamed protein product [Moneuplotes crassus]